MYELALCNFAFIVHFVLSDVCKRGTCYCIHVVDFQVAFNSIKIFTLFFARVVIGL